MARGMPCMLSRTFTWGFHTITLTGFLLPPSKHVVSNAAKMSQVQYDTHIRIIVNIFSTRKSRSARPAAGSGLTARNVTPKPRRIR